MFDNVLLMAFPALLAFGGAYDLLTMTIPNRVSIALVAVFLLAAPFAGLSPAAVLAHVGAGMVVLAAGVVLFALGSFGGGDAKLLAAAALWIGFDHLVVFLASVAILGGVLAVAILFYRNMPMLHLYAPQWAIKLHAQGTGIPYGIAIAGAALLVYPQTVWFAVPVA